MTTDLVLSSTQDVVTLRDPLQDFDDALLRFMATRKGDKTRGTYGPTLQLYRRHCALYGLDPLRLDAVIAFGATQNALRGDVSAGTIRLRLKTVQSFLSWCYTFSLTPLHPSLVAASITMPPARKLSPRDVLTAGEVARLLASAHPGIELLLLRVMLDGGLRVSEALALTAVDVYTALDRCYLHVAAGKGDKERDVLIPAELFTQLHRYTAGWEPLRRIFGKTDRVYAWRIVQRVADRAKLEKHVTPHSLRHTHAHHMRLAKMPLEVLSERLGHASIETTKVYTRPAEMARATQLPLMPWNSSGRQARHTT